MSRYSPAIKQPWVDIHPWLGLPLPFQTHEYASDQHNSGIFAPQSIAQLRPSEGLQEMAILGNFFFKSRTTVKARKSSTSSMVVRQRRFVYRFGGGQIWGKGSIHRNHQIVPIMLSWHLWIFPGLAWLFAQDGLAIPAASCDHWGIQQIFTPKRTQGFDLWLWEICLSKEGASWVMEADRLHPIRIYFKTI